MSAVALVSSASPSSIILRVMLISRVVISLKNYSLRLAKKMPQLAIEFNSLS
jgi:hypothetical protein